MKRSFHTLFPALILALMVCMAGIPVEPASAATNCDVAIYGAPAIFAWNTEIQNKLTGTGLFSKVDAYLVNSGQPVPTLAQLQQYKAVLVYNDAYFNDNAALGNVLADYMDAGGGVVLSTFSFTSGNPPGMAGRISSAGYLPFTFGLDHLGDSLTLVPDLPANPILAGVTTFSGGTSSLHNTITPTLGATLVAHWSDGDPLVATKKPTTGNIVGLNFYPPSSDASAGFWDATTNGARLMANALLWAGGCPTGAPAVSLNPTSLTFGNQGLGTTSATQTITLTNSGTTDLHVGTLTFTSDWILSNDTCSNATVTPSGTCSVDVAFHPLAIGSLTGSVGFPSDAASTPDSVSLSGNGIAPAVSLNPTSLTFGNQGLGTTSAAQTITLTNSGTATLHVGTLTFTSDWILSNDTCSNATVTPSGTCSVDVAFHPLALGSLTGSVGFPSDAASTPDSVSLSGNSIAPALGLSTNSHDFGNQQVGTTSATFGFTVTNTGSGALYIGLMTFTSDWILSNNTCATQP
jgi:hypothetical protein